MARISRKRDPEFEELLRKCGKVNAETGELKFEGIYANFCVNFGWKGEIIVVPYSHVVWFLAHGKWPDEGNHLDHINNDPTDNRLCNLSELTEAENQKKRRGRMVYRSYGTGKYGYGIYVHNDKRDGRFYVTRHLSRGHGNGDLRAIRRSLGGYDTLVDAEKRVVECIEEIKANGLEYLPAVQKTRKRQTLKIDAAAQQMRELRSQGKSVADIAALTGFGIGAVYSRVRDMGVDKRRKP